MTPTEGGVYTTTITGQIINAGAFNAVTTTFTLTVTSCLTSTDQILLITTATTPISMTLN